MQITGQSGQLFAFNHRKDVVGVVKSVWSHLILERMYIFDQDNFHNNDNAMLTMAPATPVAFFASAGHGYLLPMGFAVFAVILVQIIATTGCAV